jgi:RimJ/RimL family protein N-acetyltransferase
MITIPNSRGGTRQPAVAARADRSAPVSFVSDFRYIDLPFEVVAPAMLDASATWLHELAAGRTTASQEPAAPARPWLRPPSAIVRLRGGSELARLPVQVSLGQAREHADEIIVPVTWEPVQLQRLLPALDGDILLSRVDEANCRLGLTGRYRAPLARIGHGLDRLALHSVAESSVRRFLEEADAALRAVVGGNPGEQATSTTGGEQDVTTLDGRRLRVRPIRADDADGLVAFHETLSEESVYLRFFTPHPRLTAAEVDRFTHVDGSDRVALVVLDGDRIVAVGRYDRFGRTSEAEVAFVVTDAYQHQGIATALLRALAGIAVGYGVETFVAETLADNRRMRSVFSDAGYPVHQEFRDGLVRVSFRIDDARRAEVRA